MSIQITTYAQRMGRVANQSLVGNNENNLFSSHTSVIKGHMYEVIDSDKNRR
jgi:hypothetical protein